MTYRDTFENCPRCGVALVAAGAARACNECRGLWVVEAVLSEMVLEMLPPGQLARLELAVLDRAGEGLGCPSCGERMTPTTVHAVQLDRCPRQHGVWFDRDELQAALYSVARHGIPPAAPAEPAPYTESVPRELTLSIWMPDQFERDMTVRDPVIKIGRIATAHVRIEGDDRVERMHAIIENEREPTIFDLGSRHGTLVNGARVDRQVLRSGDTIAVGATTIVVSW